MDPSKFSLDLMDVDLDGLLYSDSVINDAYMDEYLKGLRADDLGTLDDELVPQEGAPHVSEGFGHHDRKIGHLDSNNSSSSAHSAGQLNQPFVAAPMPLAEGFTLSTARGDEEEVSASIGASKRAGVSSARKVTPQRKQNNRKAQQRYREKRKQQVADMEQRVAALTNQLESLQACKAQAEAVSGENEQLRSMLQQQTEEIAKLKSQMQVQSVTAPVTGDGDECGMVRKIMPYEEAAEQLAAIATKLRAALEAAGLSPLRVRDATFKDGSLAAEITQLIEEADRASVFMLLGTPACPYRQSACSTNTAAAVHPCAHFRQRWTSILKDLALDEDQENALLDGRRQLLAQLRTLYEERAKLNMHTMSLMLPRADSSREDDGTTDGKLRCIEQWGSHCALRHSSALRDVLDSIRASLCKEVKLLIHLHQLLTRKVLRPVQQAVLFVRAQHEPLIEPLHFTNLIALQRGLLEEPAGKENHSTKGVHALPANVPASEVAVKG